MIKQTFSAKSPSHQNIPVQARAEEQAERTYTGDNGFYCSVDIRQPQLQPLVQLFKRAVGFDMPLNPDQDIGLHCTVMYSKQALSVDPDLANKANARVKDLIMRGRVTKFDYWDGHNDKGYFVAKLDSPDLQARHNLWKSMGAVPTFDPYEAHMTIVDGPDAKVLAKQLDMLNQALAASAPITLLLVNEVIADQND